MATDLGGGKSLESVTVTPSFPGGAGSASLLIPDELFPDIKGSLRYSSGTNLNARTVGQTAMGATATGVIRGSNVVVGMKQVASFKFHTAFYAGLKDSDGCIEETTTGLNFQVLLDCSANDNLQSPWAPFYLPRKIAPNGAPFTVEMPDQPAGRLRLQRRNAGRDRLNFLLAYRSQCDFLAYFVVERSDGRHQPIKGFQWHYNHDIDIAWSKGQPSIIRSAASVAFDSAIDNLQAGDRRFDILANAQLTTADTIVTKFNQAMFAAQRREPSGNYAITEFANYTPNITPDMQGRLSI
jgi:hypothetical protein